MSVRQIHIRRERQPAFFFLANHPALDFLNTRPVLDDEPVELITDFSALLRWFEAAGLVDASRSKTLERKWDMTREARGMVREVLEFRERLRTEVLAWSGGATLRPALVDHLNRLMSDHPMLTRLTFRGSTTYTERWFEPREPEDLLAPLAHSVATLFAGADRERVRRCGSCVGIFYDTSKKGTRRWCSMQLCGNRSKVAAYAARRRKRS